jgi:hypothetical protein
MLLKSSENSLTSVTLLFLTSYSILKIKWKENHKIVIKMKITRNEICFNEFAFSFMQASDSMLTVNQAQKSQDLLVKQMWTICPM